MRVALGPAAKEASSSVGVGEAQGEPGGDSGGDGGGDGGADGGADGGGAYSSTACLRIGVGHAPCMATHSAPAAQPLRSAAPTSSGSCTYLLGVRVRVRVRVRIEFWLG